MTKFFKNPCNVYIALLTFYSMQGTIIPTGGSLLSQIIMLTTICMSMYYTVKVFLMPGKPIYFSGLNLFFLLLVIYGSLLLVSDHQYVIAAKAFNNEVSNHSYLKNLLLSLPNIYTLYYFSRKNYLTEDLLKKWVLVFIVVAIFRFIDYQITALQAVSIAGTDDEEITNNMGYLFLALLPAVVVFKNKIRVQFFFLIICMLFILIGMKRGAIIIGCLSLIYYLYFTFRFNRNISKTKAFLFSICIIFASFLIVKYMLASSDYFNYRLESTREGNTGGRNELFALFWNHFRNEPNFFKFLFGNGANATLGIGDNYAHNDWLEIAINQGLLGLIIYGFYWVCFIKTIASIKYNKTAKLVLTLSFMAFFLKTMFSMSYTTYSIIPCTLLGYYLAHSKDRD